MTGKSHLATNISCSVITINSLAFLSVSQMGTISESSVKILDFMIGKGSGFPIPVWIGLGAIMFLIGSLLPDIDSGESMISKILHFHIPIEHRTWTHSFWAVILLVIATFAFRPCLFLLLGYVLHLFWDSLSSAGVCFFYPIDKYRHYGNNAKVKKGHKLKIYYTGQPSEYVLLGIILTLTVVMCVILAINGVYGDTLDVIKQSV